ncbi:hypothetical protein PL8927_790146 [Planktothrix serta PCC 8927]|uniref:Uncharacterized protein n=1 Tax=Planktothrix serta PCC 8927 TaxID=671068 RepID=A0A7Z9BYQ4_9CYAN|nr:hypothetical protein PL8927_790146 [Planktothrix serta PCC 8927]
MSQSQFLGLYINYQFCQYPDLGLDFFFKKLVRRSSDKPIKSSQSSTIFKGFDSYFCL